MARLKTMPTICPLQRLRQNKAKVNTEKEQSSHVDGYEEHSGKYVQILKDGKQRDQNGEEMGA